MLLTITTTHQPATDLGYLLYKHPERFQSFDLNFGQAYVFYTEATVARCTAAMVLDIDPVRLVRAVGKHAHAPLKQYVNDRPYVASSFLSVALSNVLGSALNGNCKDRPELADTPIPMQATLSTVPCRGGEVALRAYFEPMGYEVEAERVELDAEFSEWGESRYWNVSLSGIVRVQDLLSHIYVLVPALDDDKHYFIGKDEVEKLLRQGEGWLADHPAKEDITRRYLKRQRSLVRPALERLEELSDAPVPEPELGEEALERPLSLHQIRLQTVVDILKDLDVRSVADLGCGEGKLVRKLLDEPQFRDIQAVDVSHRTLQIAARRLKLERMSDDKRSRLTLRQSSLVYRDRELQGYQAAVLIEVIEHLEPERLRQMSLNVFKYARPRFVVMTTPNAEYNVLFEGMAPGAMRHRDHRFEWTRAQFRDWCRRIEDEFGYEPTWFDVGEVSDEHGPPTQGVVFRFPD